MTLSTVTQTSPLRAVRLARGRSLRDVARAAGVDPGALSKIERGLRRPTLSVLAKLAEVLGLTELAGFLKPYLGVGQ